MKKHIKKAAISEIPVLLKGIAIIIFTQFCYFAGIVFADYAAGRELNYFEDINNYVEEKLAEYKPSPTPVPRATPTSVAKESNKPSVQNSPEPRTVTSNISPEYELRPESRGFALLYKNDEIVDERNHGFKTNNLYDFFFDESSESIFIIESDAPFLKGNIEFVKKIKRDGNSTNINILNMQYGSQLSSTSFIDYLSDDELIVLKTAGGDGCGGGGYIWTLSEMKRETIAEFGIGCGYPERPRYLGYSNNNFYFSNIKFDSENFNFDNEVDVIDRYFINIFTNQKTYISQEELNSIEFIETQ